MIAGEPEHVDAHFQRGIGLANLEQLDAAIAAYSRAIELDPGHVRALYARASCRNRKADFALANGVQTTLPQLWLDKLSVDFLPSFNCAANFSCASKDKLEYRCRSDASYSLP